MVRLIGRGGESATTQDAVFQLNAMLVLSGCDEARLLIQTLETAYVPKYTLYKYQVSYYHKSICVVIILYQTMK